MTLSFDYAAHGLQAPTRRPEIPGGPRTVAEALDRALAERPEAEALVGRHARYTYRRLDAEANAAAAALAELGVGPFDRVAASLPNCTEIVVAFLATMRLGAIWVGINRPLAPPEKAYMLADSGARVFLGDAAMVGQVRAKREELPALAHVLAADPGDGASEWARLLAKHAGAPRPKVEIDPFAPAAIAYTSGTTGFPKGAVHHQHNLLIPGVVDRAMGVFGPEDRQGVLLPLSILNLMVLVPVNAFLVGGACVVMDKIDPVGIAEWVRTERVMHFAAVPAMYHDLLTHPEVSEADLRALTRPQVGGADCPEAFLELYRKRFRKEVINTYGMTEAPTAVTRADPEEPHLPGCSGKTLPHVRLFAADEAGRELPPGEVGEICVAPAEAGPLAGVYTLMLGYWGRPEETAKALRGGAYHSGDLGSVDAEGNIFIRGRKGEMILRGGANVYPAEVERVLHDDPRVAACAVLGRPDPRLGERVVAFVQLARGAAATAEELKAHCLANLAKYKVPEDFRFVEALPRNTMGKILKRELKAML